MTIIRPRSRAADRFRALAITAGATVALALGAAATIHANPPRRPAAATVPDAYLSLATRASRGGVFTAGVVARTVAPGAAETWLVRVADRDGRPVSGAALRATPWMPDAGARMQPRRVDAIAAGAGVYRIGGLHFTRPGWWTVPVRITAGRHADTVVFNLIVPSTAVCPGEEGAG